MVAVCCPGDDEVYERHCRLYMSHRRDVERHCSGGKEGRNVTNVCLWLIV